MGGYAYQEGELTETQSSTARKGATLAQLPRHSASLWNRYDFSPQWGVGLGAIYRSSVYTSTDNTVTLVRFTRLEGARFYKVSAPLRSDARRAGNACDSTGRPRGPPCTEQKS